VRVGVVGSDENAMQLSAGDTLPIITEDIKEKTLPPDLDNQPHMHPVNHRSIHNPASIPLASSVSSTDTSASSTASSSFDTSTSSSTSPESDLTSVSSCSVNPDTTPG
jgi:dual specificity MAP kinase phosphatase